jgi:hypothetical protein
MGTDVRNSSSGVVVTLTAVIAVAAIAIARTAVPTALPAQAGGTASSGKRPEPAPRTLLDLGLDGIWRMDQESGALRVERAGRELRLSSVSDGRLVGVITVDADSMQFENQAVKLTARATPAVVGEWALVLSAPSDCSRAAGKLRVSANLLVWAAELSCLDVKDVSPTLTLRAELAPDHNVIKVSEGGGPEPHGVFTLRRQR